MIDRDGKLCEWWVYVNRRNDGGEPYHLCSCDTASGAGEVVRCLFTAADEDVERVIVAFVRSDRPAH